MSQIISRLMLTKVLLLVRSNGCRPCLVEVVKYDIGVGEVGIGLEAMLARSFTISCSVLTLT